MAQSTYKNIGESSHLGVLIVKEGVGIVGEAPTIEIRRSRDNAYLDFSATADPFFVSSGGQQKLPLAPSASQDGLYEYQFNPQDANEELTENYTVLYENVSTEYPILDFETLNYSAELIDRLAFIRKILDNNQTLSRVSNIEAVNIVFDDDGTTPVSEHRIELSGNDEIRTKL